MATTIRDLLVKLGVDAEGADAEVQKLDQALTDLKDIMLGAIAAGAAVTAVLAGVAASSAAAGDAIDKGSQAAAIATDRYQELAFMASQSGTSIETVTKALGKQTTALGQMADGSGTAGDELAALGLTYDQLAAMSPDEQFQATAEAISNLGSEQEMLQAATAIYGEDMAQQLLPLLKQGAEGMDEMAAMAHELGLVMSEEQIAAAVEFTDTWDQVWRMLQGVKNTIGLALLPVLTDLLSRLRDWYTENRRLIATRLEQWMDVLVAGIQAVGRMASIVNDIVMAVFGGWEPVLIAVAGLVAVVGAGMAALAGMQAWSAISSALAAIGAIGAGTFGVIIAAVLQVIAVWTLLALVIDDLIVFFRGGDSALGRFLDRFREADGVLGAAARGIETLIGIGMRLWALVQTLGAIWWAVFSRTILPAVRLLGAAVMWLAEQAFGLLGWYWDNVLNPMFQAFGAAINWLLVQLQALQPAIDWLIGKLDTLLGALSAISGVDVTVGGDAGAAGEDGAGGSAGLLEGGGLFGGGDTGTAGGDAVAASAAVAPSTTEAVGGAGTFAGAGAPASQNLTVDGNQYTFNGVGWTEEQLLDLIRRSEDERARATSAALEGGEV